MNSNKSIKAKTYKMYNFENSRNYLKLNLEFPEYSKGFKWILGVRCGYKIDTRRIDHWFINCFLFKNLRINYFSDLDRNFFYFLDSLFNSLVVTSNNASLDDRINNIVKGYKSSNNIRINRISIIDILGNRKIVNRYRIYIFLIGGREYGFNERNNCPYKMEWECLFKCQTESGTYSKSPFLLRFSHWIFNCKAFEQNRIQFLITLMTLFFKFALTIENKSMEISIDSDKKL
ncbi:hypothetical protein BCR32DRAFT_283566 [Anaeromyces robustus]|uniref:Uncharacterized protein n=1 Tax=Anaeromyces robustus TaxID=1754192 RepID=A0A1Y1WUD4_9FUNG|nr:hypothetical protein BCR32DRAFT_283566 [Anaeromyces robustus]|eukprot:ORX77062.1 hypothetical protein BCR32DRAFT_283566 [Anaeromyces robustus]